MWGSWGRKAQWSWTWLTAARENQLTLGGSVVILIPTWRMEMGNCGWGVLLNHSLKSGWASCTWSCSTILSNCGIHVSDKWQLARNTQLPLNQYKIINNNQKTPCKTQVAVLGRATCRLSVWKANFAPVQAHHKSSLSTQSFFFHHAITGTCAGS